MTCRASLVEHSRASCPAALQLFPPGVGLRAHTRVAGGGAWREPCFITPSVPLTLVTFVLFANTGYAQSSQIRQIRKKMTGIMTREASSVDLKGLVTKLIPNMIGREIEKSCSSIYPLQNVYIRKVKVLKAPKVDIAKLMELHGDGSDEVGKKLAATKPTEYEDVKRV